MSLDNNNLDNYDYEGILEKIRKYGDPRRSFIATAIVILIIAIIVNFFLWKKENLGITGFYSSFYPENTQVYVDAQLPVEQVQQFNKLTGLGVKDFPDLLNRLFSQENIKREKVNKLMSQALGDSFSFGTWVSHNDGKPVERNLAIFSVKREVKLTPLFNEIFGRKEKLKVRKYQGYKVITTASGKGAFLVSRNRLFLADSYNTLLFTIDNFFLKKSKNLESKKQVQKAVSFLEKGRIGTVILSDYRLFTDNSPLPKLGGQLADIEKLSRNDNVTAVSILVDKNLIYFNSYTPYDLSKFIDKSLYKAFKVLLREEFTNFKPDHLPQNTLSYISVRNLNDYFNLVLEFSGISRKPEFEQMKQFLSMITSLDFDNDILKIFENDTIMMAINDGNGRPRYAAILRNQDKTEVVVSKLVKLLQVQVPSVEIVKSAYKNFNLNRIDSKDLPVSIYFGKINSDLFAIGERTAIESLINSVNSKSGLSETQLFRNFMAHNLENPKLSVYFNMLESDKIISNKANAQSRIYIDKAKNNIDSLLFTANTNNDVIRGSLQLHLNNK